MVNGLKQFVKKIPGAVQTRMLMDAFHAPLSVIVTNHSKILKYKDRYKAKRCFIIGNGPSLTARDLDKIKGEYSFAANRIYHIFSETDWRPSFYCIQDENMFQEMDIQDLVRTADSAEASFIRMRCYMKMTDRCRMVKNRILVPVWDYPMKDYKAPFTRHADKYIFDGCTVTYMSMQLAAYMGFSNIYLLGVDHNFPYRRMRNGEIAVNNIQLVSHFYDRMINCTDNEAGRVQANDHVFVTNSYQSAENYSRWDGSFRIWNATRGGILEVFDRASLDEIVKND